MENRTICLLDLIYVIHYTIIDKLGKNEIVLSQIQDLEIMIKFKKLLENYSVEDNENWKDIVETIKNRTDVL